MTVSQSVIAWLNKFEQKSVNTDIQPAKVNSYSLVKEPIINKKAFISGRVRATEHYTLMARLESQMDSSRVENSAWGEKLEEWVRDMCKKKDLPVIDGATVQSVNITTPFYLGKSEVNESVYQLTISITYEKE